MQQIIDIWKGKVLSNVIINKNIDKFNDIAYSSIVDYKSLEGNTMLNKMVISDIINAIVPISRFNKGEANKIFDEVKQNGYKIVMKNNTPACILVSPEKYEEMTEQLENHALFIETEKRMKNAGSNDFISEKATMEQLGIKEEDLEDGEVEID